MEARLEEFGPPASKRVKKVEAPPPPNMSTTGLGICKSCNLVFLTYSALKCHFQSANHKLAVTGHRPNHAKFCCFLCWEGFALMDELRRHYLRETHETNCIDHSVKAIWMTGNSSTIVNENSAVSGDTSPISLTSSSDEEEASALSCVPCNLYFESDKFVQRHLVSENHQAVISAAFKQGKLNCFLCNCGFESAPELASHFASEEHKVKVISDGISGFIKDLICSVDLELDKVSSSEEIEMALEDVNSPDVSDFHDDLEPIDSPDDKPIECDTKNGPFEAVDSPEQLPHEEEPVASAVKNGHQDLEDVNSPEKLSETLEAVDSPEESFDDQQEILEHNDNEFLVIDSVE